ncbi:beta-lactamase regulating signal transducer with metallopeptidase domain [Gillisia sp. Hel_I_86]|uniref:M56 family metallopeptidase n=1 Tax=Gillisia sp. Hel_I_86 TaxID=1249981 RepID=UPI001199317D|nr:M56 family metallopeptidase [Gillisia sp. Hel_I_86]TVZ25816.1 beta-lactamase regulating signal transducer with metallopeptidase domain [Gillisia sp. Hel_I_86]
MSAIILQIILFQLMFLLVYELLLKKETFFRYNRWYLLLSPVIALMLPFLNITALNEIVPQESVAAINGFLLPEVFIGNAQQSMGTLPEVHISSNKTSINWWMLIYSFGVLLSLGIVFKKFLNLRKLFQFNLIKVENTYRIIEVPASNLACTFYKTIFLGDRLLAAEKKQILAHELIHVKEKHSLDLVFFEVFKIVFWFNPLIYIYQNRIATLHEFIADSNVVNTIEKRSYYEQLLNTAFNTQNISFINQFFNHSLIKKRIVMLQKSQSKTISKFKYLIILPVLLAMLTIVSCTQDDSQISAKDETLLEQLERIQTTINNSKEISGEEKDKMVEITMAALKKSEEGMINNSDATTIDEKVADVPFAVIDQVPLFPGCESLSSNEEQKKCMSQKIQEHVIANFNSELGKEVGLTGVNRVIVQFKIDKNGEIVDVKARAPHPKLKEEAIRVVKSIPQMIPGKQKGEAVGVMYSLPIVFEVNE